MGTQVPEYAGVALGHEEKVYSRCWVFESMQYKFLMW